MKKEVIIRLTVEQYDFETDEFIKNDIEREISCCSKSYDIEEIIINSISPQNQLLS